MNETHLLQNDQKVVLEGFLCSPLYSPQCGLSSRSLGEGGKSAFEMVYTAEMRMVPYIYAYKFDRYLRGLINVSEFDLAMGLKVEPELELINIC